MAKVLSLIVNGETHRVSADPERPLLTVLRDELGLTGAKYGCGEGACGACTVLIDGVATRACVTPPSEVAGKRVTTIEGLETERRPRSEPSKRATKASPEERESGLHPVQQAFLDAGAMQCGYCIPGMILGAVALLARTPRPSADDIVMGMDGHVCRCGTYPRILAAIQAAARKP
jgi:aerobic-type carbon monoxide dehydrogenase small subunit (CoxS/CutS family)